MKFARPFTESDFAKSRRMMASRNRRGNAQAAGGGDVFVFQSKAFVASDFFATLSMTWTVGAGDVVTYRYAKNGKLLKIILRLTGTTVGGTVSGANLQIKLPEGLTAKSDQIVLLTAAPGGGVSEQVLGFITAGSNIFTILRNSSNWVLGSDNTDVGGTFEIEFN